MSLLSWLLKRFAPGLVDAAVEEVEAQLEPEEEPVPLTHRSVEHQQKQIRSATQGHLVQEGARGYWCAGPGSVMPCADCRREDLRRFPLTAPVVSSPRAITERHCIPPPRPPRKR